MNSPFVKGQLIVECGHLDEAFAIFGLRETPDGEWGMSPEMRPAFSPFFATAREMITRHLDPAAFRILSETDSAISDSTYDFYAATGPERERRHAFARAWPSFAARGVHAGASSGRRRSVIDEHADPDDAVSALLRMEAPQLSPAAMALCIRRLRGRRWPAGGRSENALEMFALLADDRLPRDDDAGAFLYLCTELPQHLPYTLPERFRLCADLASSIPGSDWIERRRRWSSDGAARAKPLGRVPTQDCDDAYWYFGQTIPLLTRFAWRALLPAFGLDDEVASHVVSYGANVGIDDRPLVPPRAFENAGALLFLEDIDYSGYLHLSAGAHEILKTSPPNTLALMGPDRTLVEKAFSAYRPLFRPKYRDISVADAVALARGRMAAFGASIAGYDKVGWPWEDQKASAHRRL